MPQSLSNVLVHIVFSTKNRQPFFESKSLRTELHCYLAGISKSSECPPVGVGGIADHVHLLCRQSRTISLADWIKELKRVSSTWMKTKGPAFRTFQWQSGYGAFSVSQSQSPRVETYTANQERHHRKMSFQEEFRALLVKHQIEFDEKYLWD